LCHVAAPGTHHDQIVTPFSVWPAAAPLRSCVELGVGRAGHRDQNVVEHDASSIASPIRDD
jgi:hypothetical protein